MREGWEIRKLGELLIFDKRFNGIPKEQQGTIAHFNHVSAEELKSLKVDDGNVKLISTGQFDGYTTEELAGGNLNRGEIITIPTGGVANIKYYTGLFVDSGNLIGIARDKSINLKYVYYGMTCKKEVINSFYRGVSIKHPFMPDICKITLPIPSVQQQEKIVAELDCLTVIIEKKKQQLEELDKLAQSIFYEMFGDPFSNEKGWDVKKLGEEFGVASGGTPSTKENAYWENGDIPWIGSNMCHNEVIYDNDGKFITEAGLNNSSARLFRKGFVLVALVGATIGKVALIEFDTTTNQNIAGIDVPANKSFTSFFVFYLIQSLYCLFESIGEGKFKMANLSFIRSLPLIAPPTDLQELFAQKIETIEKQKKLFKRSIMETETLFNSRMDFWFNN